MWVLCTDDEAGRIRPAVGGITSIGMIDRRPTPLLLSCHQILVSLWADVMPHKRNKVTRISAMDIAETAKHY